jgi:hypothetical protein
LTTMRAASAARSADTVTSSGGSDATQPIDDEYDEPTHQRIPRSHPVGITVGSKPVNPASA